MTGYDRSHAEGFIRLFGLPLAAAAAGRHRGTRPPPLNGTAPAVAPALEEDRVG